LDWIGLDWIGLDWIGLDWIGLDWIGLDWIGLDWISSSFKFYCVMKLLNRKIKENTLSDQKNNKSGPLDFSFSSSSSPSSHGVGRVPQRGSSW
jgi:hypothetical protein